MKAETRKVRRRVLVTATIVGLIVFAPYYSGKLLIYLGVNSLVRPNWAACWVVGVLVLGLVGAMGCFIWGVWESTGEVKDDNA